MICKLEYIGLTYIIILEIFLFYFIYIDKEIQIFLAIMIAFHFYLFQREIHAASNILYIYTIIVADVINNFYMQFFQHNIHIVYFSQFSIWLFNTGKI